MQSSAFFRGAAFAAAALPALMSGCRSKSTVADEPLASASAAVPAAPVVPLAPGEAEAALNPGHRPPYSGPIGSVRGVIRVSGDPSPELPEVKRKIRPGRCDDARAFYGTLFREGPGRELGDVLVAVTGYDGYIPDPTPVKKVVAKGCAYESRTIAMLFGQRLDVQNRGPETFIPRLRGAKQLALVVAMPNGDTVKLFPNHVGEYELIDETHDFATAQVFVLKYPTFDVTGLDGKYEITGIPAGEVDLSAMLPQTRAVAHQKVKIVAGEVTVVDLTIPFSAAKGDAAPTPTPTPSPSVR